MDKKINLISKPKDVEKIGEAPWNKKKLKKIMTDLAAGHISKKEAQDLIKPEKTSQKGLKQKFKGKPIREEHLTRKRKTKSKEVK